MQLEPMQLDRHRLFRGRARLAAALFAVSAGGAILGLPAAAQDAPPPAAPAPEAPAPEAPAPEAPAPEAPEAEAPQTDPQAPAAAAPEPDAAAPDAAPAEDAPPPPPGATGDPAQSEVLEIVRDTFGAWEVRCLPEGDECFMYQLALDPEDNPVAEVSILKLPPEAEAEAASGVTVVTPLGTLLTEGIVLQIDQGESLQYPFSWCSQVGCFARFGLTDTSINEMKRGNAGRMTLVSVGAPDAPVTLEISLSGFTAAYDSLTAPAN